MSQLPINLYNTLSGRREPFVTVCPGEAGIYVCGVTVYDRCHLGHIRGAINFDVIRKFLMFAGYRVRFIKNYTDVDDKIIARAQESGKEIGALCDEMIRLHDEDMEIFGVQYPDIAPRATDHIRGMISVIEKLMQKGFAYHSGNDVYFRTQAFADYGCLSGKITDELDAGHRITVSELKQQEHDFVLWKGHKPGEPFWESPWGNGRPGWHIECSAMSKTFLGEEFDIHGGGSDLIFPHHENEIAQSACSTGKIPARYWLHNGMITIDGKKMSKSLGNFIPAHQLASQYHPEVIRLFCIKSHDRQKVNFTHGALAEAADNLDRLYTPLMRFASASDIQNILKQTLPVYTDFNIADKSFSEAMGDDFNTPSALAALFAAAGRLNALTDTDTPPAQEELTYYIRCGQILGIFGTPAKDWFKQPRAKSDTAARLTPEEIEALIRKRTDARRRKDWQAADAVRDRLKQNGIIIQDKGEETIWQYE